MAVGKLIEYDCLESFQWKIPEEAENPPAKVVLDGMCVFHLFVQWVTFDTSFRL